MCVIEASAYGLLSSVTVLEIKLQYLQIVAYIYMSDQVTLKFTAMLFIIH
jgi:hypothetical protein